MPGEFKPGWVEKTYSIDNCDVMIDINPDDSIANIYTYTDSKPFLEDAKGNQLKVKWRACKNNNLYIEVVPNQLEEVYQFLVDNDYLYELEEDLEDS